VKLPAEISGRAAPQSSNDFTGRQRGSRRDFLVQLAIVFLASYVLLFAVMTRRPGFYDEGIMLTGAMRVAAGQIPHRDFHYIYGPAEIYILSGLFKIFGTSLLVERLFDLLIKALLVTSVYAIALSYCRRAIAIFISVVTILWLYGMKEFGIATTPVSLLNLVGSYLILPTFVGRVSTRRMFAAGAISGVAALFRPDTGIALAGIHACVISIAVYLRFKGAANRLVIFASTFWPYLLGFAILTIPAAIYYLSVAPLAAMLEDIVFYPAKYYHRGRYLPFPGIDVKGLENLGVYLPIAITGVSVYALVARRFRVRPSDADRLDNTRQTQEWYGFLVTFTILLIVMYLKGLVRAAPLQMYLAIVPSLLLAAVLFQHRASFSRPVRISISGLLWLSLLPAAWSALHEARFEYVWHSSVAERFLSLTRNAGPGTETEWCKIANPITTGFCFFPEEDRVHAIEFIGSHTQPGQTLYVGVSHHDRIFANDNIIYFATQRIPATRWSHFDPDLQNRYDIQTQMVDELEHNAPPYIVLDSEFELSREPNDSSKSSGVTLLDRYIHDKYQPGETFGTMSVWQRRSP
jgi:hypothetical protein